MTLLVTEPTRGAYEGVFTDVLSGTTFLGLDCTVTGTRMRCSAEYPDEAASFSVEGPVSSTRYTGDVRATLGAQTLTGTFDLSRTARP